MLIVDGYNVLMKMPTKGRTLEDRREDLINALNRKHRLFGGITLVFDGKEEFIGSLRKEKLDIQVVYTKNGPADEYIKTVIKNSKNPKAIVVATDDREIRDFAKIHHSHHISSVSLIKKILPPQNHLPRYRGSKEMLIESKRGKAITEELRKEWEVD